jgi:hypothetical protein
LSVCFTLSTLAYGQFSQQGAKLTGTGAVGAAEQGYSVALSADGNTAVVGGSGDNGGAGAAWVFNRINGNWNQQGTKLTGTGATGNAVQGVSVALSADGNTALVGGPYDSDNIGATWVFVRSNGIWTQQGPKLTGNDAVGQAYQGYSLALSADGNTALVGDFFDNHGVGAAWVYTRSNGVWSQQGAKLIGSGAGQPAQQGFSVSLSADGNTALVGGCCDLNSGATWVFIRSNGVWTQQGAKLVGTGAVGGSAQGSSVALSGDGNTAIIGGPDDNNLIGAAWIFVRIEGVWYQQGAKLTGTGALGQPSEGISVALSANGDTAIIGGSADLGSGFGNGWPGAVWLFTSSGGFWTQQGAKVVGSGAVGFARQGNSVALSADGSTALIGGPADNNYAGAAWVFTQPTVPTVVTTNPEGLDLSADGITYQSPATFSWAAGSLHTVNAPDPQLTIDTQYLFANWSDGGAPSHRITVAQLPSTLTADFNTQYQLTISASPPAGGTVSPLSGAFFVAGAAAPVVATPNSGYQFVNWTGAVSSMNAASTSVTMSGPQVVVANFAPTGSHPAFFAGEALTNGIYDLQLPDGNPFGYYVYLSGGWIYHADLGYEYLSAGNGSEVYLWDLATGHWWYTNSGTFPYMYDFTLNTWIYYFPNTHNAGHYTTNPRSFANMTTSQIFTM